MLLGNVWRLFCFVATNAGEYVLSWGKKICITLLLSTISVCIASLLTTSSTFIASLLSTSSVSFDLLLSTRSVYFALLLNTSSACFALLLATISVCITLLLSISSTCIDLLFSTNQHALLLLTQYVFLCCHNHNRDSKSLCQHREDTRMFLRYIDLQNSKKNYNFNNFTYQQPKMLSPLLLTLLN